jgi:3-oxoacyl-[acyl-carrier-protein] synthase II
VARALERAGRPRGEVRDRTGLFVGASRRPVAANTAYRRSFLERGPARASAAAFARTVMNAAGGAVTRAFSLRGPTDTVASGPGAGLVALAAAALHLGGRLDADALVVAAADEADPLAEGRDPEDRSRPAPPGSARFGAGAAAVVLARGPDAVGIAGIGLAGPGQLARAVRAALGPDPAALAWSTAAGPRGEERERAAIREVLGPIPVLPSPAREEGWCEAATSLAAVARAVRLLEAGPGRVLVVGDDGETASAAVVLERRD